ncbi:hypothetical protein JCM33374_g1026 [Metschnikowia sp. JCM 33374]|nr:hypothetical protein JCM33374_g1026 [Metschnikowia sp. JCM 33374]
MDLIGDIVEHEPEVPTEPIIEQHAAISGFPQLKKFDNFKPRNSRFKAGSATQKPPQTSAQTRAGTKPNGASNSEGTMTEAQRIHKENLQKISSLTEDEVTKEREELLQGLDPRLIQTLLKRTEARKPEHNHDHAEGYDGWIGGGKNGIELPSLNDVDVNKALGIKSVSFKDEDEYEEVRGYDDEDAEDSAEEDDGELRRQPLDHFTDDEDDQTSQANIQKAHSRDDEDDEVAPEGYQIIADEPVQPPEVHFPRPKVAREDPEMDLNDPNFFENLHEKYFPDLPKETSKLAWMTTPMPQHKVSSYEAIGDMRFDFQGKLG